MEKHRSWLQELPASLIMNWPLAISTTWANRYLHFFIWNGKCTSRVVRWNVRNQLLNVTKLMNPNKMTYRNCRLI